MISIRYWDRQLGEEKLEKVYCGDFLQFLYGNGFWSDFFGKPLLYVLSRFPFVSSIIGFWKSLPITKGAIAPFIKEYQVDTAEFEKNVEDFTSFNDFFIRELKKEVRPIASDPHTAVIPADGRYLFFPNIQKADGFLVKGQKFNLADFLKNEELASRYENGTMVMARLCPADYHRFHFPCDGIPSATSYINGWLYSVNPSATRQNIRIFTQNKRTVCTLQTKEFGDVVYVEIGATAVGSIHQTYQSNCFQSKGSEKGFFSFGGSSIILLFEPNRITLAPDLLELSKKGLEIKCLMGQVLGVR